MEETRAQYCDSGIAHILGKYFLTINVNDTLSAMLPRLFKLGARQLYQDTNKS